MSQVRRQEQAIVGAYGPGQTTYTQSTYVQPGVNTTKTYEYSGVPQYAVQGQRQVVREGAVVREGGSRAVAADIPVESRIEYIPFEKKYVEYEEVEKVYQVPVEYEEVQYEEVVRNERVPYERTITDYYAVETQVEYIKREVEETIMVEEPVERTYERVQYIPVETQIVHYPERDNYVAQPTKTRTEYLGVLENGYQGGEVREVRRQDNYARPVQTRVEQRVETRGAPTYVAGGNNVDVVTRTSGVGATTYTTNTAYVPTAQTTYVAPTSSTYQTTGYVTGGSGVRQGSGTGYVTGGSGVRTSTVNKASYETQPGLKY